MLAADQTPNESITASRVKNTPVFNVQGDRIGHIEDLSIDKLSGETRYALMSFGGFLGMGDKLWPLPWDLLRFDVAQGGYVVDVPKEALKKAPNYDREELEAFGGDRDYRGSVYDYYGQFGARPYWPI